MVLSGFIYESDLIGDFKIIIISNSYQRSSDIKIRVYYSNIGNKCTKNSEEFIIWWRIVVDVKPSRYVQLMESFKSPGGQ